MPLTEFSAYTLPGGLLGEATIFAKLSFHKMKRDYFVSITTKQVSSFDRQKVIISFKTLLLLMVWWVAIGKVSINWTLQFLSNFDEEYFLSPFSRFWNRYWKNLNSSFWSTLTNNCPCIQDRIRSEHVLKKVVSSYSKWAILPPIRIDSLLPWNISIWFYV